MSDIAQLRRQNVVNLFDKILSDPELAENDRSIIVNVKNECINKLNNGYDPGAVLREFMLAVSSEVFSRSISN